MAQAQESSFVAPYISFRTLTNLLDRMKEHGAPDQIDRSYLGYLSGTVQSQTIAALKSLGLTDDEGRVTDRLKQMVADREIRPAVMADILRERYPAALALGPGATPQQLDDAIRGYGVTGETLRKAVTFYLHAAQFAGLTLSPHFKLPRGSRQPPSGGGTTRRKRRAPRTPAVDPIPPPANRSAGSVREQFIAMMMAKAESQEEMDEKLLDRIQTEIDKLEASPQKE